MNIKGAIFDMDGTLIDSLLIWDVIWEKLGVKFLKRDGFRPSVDDDKSVRSMTLREAMCFIHSTYNVGNNGEEVLDAVNEIVADFYSNDVEMKKGALNFLEYCYNRGIKMCIASATDLSLIKIAVEHCNIGKYFTDILSCAQMLLNKGEPIISEDTFAIAISNHTEKMSESRGLGFLYVDEKYSQTGNLFNKGSFGHCGHTGQSLFVDPATGLYVIILSDMTLSTIKKFGADTYGEVILARENIHNSILKDLGGNL